MDGTEFLFTSNGSERRFYKQNDTLYADDGTTVSVVSTGWLKAIPVSFFGMGEYLVGYCGPKRVVIRMPVATPIEENFDLAAPGTAGVAVASSATAGALVAGNKYTVYIVQLNANTGRRSGPIGPFTVTIAAGQSSYDINTMPPAPADAQFTHFEVYRTQANLTTPFLSKIFVIGTAGTLQNDGVADALLTFSQPLPQSPFGDYYVGVPPTPLAGGNKLAIPYRDMILTFAYRNTMYPTEPGSNHRFSSLCKVQFPCLGYDFTAVCEGIDEVIVATEREIFRLRGTGVYNTGGVAPVPDWQITKLSDDYGCFNPKCLLKVGQAVYGIGLGGAFVIDAGGLRPLKKVIRPDRLRASDYNFSPTTSGGNMACLGYDPAHRMLWASLPLKDTVINSAQAPKSVVAVYPIDETGTVSYFDMQIGSFFKGGGRRSFISGGTDHSRTMLAGDSYGNELELEWGDNDGKSDPTGYVVSSAIVASQVATIKASGMGAAQLPARGVRVVGLPSDGTVDPVVGTVLSNNTVDSFDIADWGGAAATGTTFYIGGILGWYETGALVFDQGQEGGFAEYVLTEVRMYLHDLVYDESDNLASPTNQPHVYAQVKIDGGNWGPRVVVFDGTTYPLPGKLGPSTLVGKSEAGGRSKGGVTFRLRFLVVVGNKPARIFAYEPGLGDPGVPAGK